jgi:hypothetical protein
VASDISQPLRSEVSRRAAYHCEYCLIHEDDAGFPHEIDHIISRKHGGLSDPENLAYACVLCNRHKGSDVASIDPHTREAVPLFHPRRDRWADHFRLDGERITPISPVGGVTVQLLHMNAAERLAERQLLQRLGVYPAH